MAESAAVSSFVHTSHTGRLADQFISLQWELLPLIARRSPQSVVITKLLRDTSMEVVAAGDVVVIAAEVGG